MMRLKFRALLLALVLIFSVSSLAIALYSEPKSGSEVAPGDAIAYTYTLTADVENCALRLSLGAGLTLREGSVKVSGDNTAEIIYGSDGFVIMADNLKTGTFISFVADVSSSAMEIWAQITAGDGSISEEDGYAAHILVLPAESNQVTPAPEGYEVPDAGRPGVNRMALSVVAIALASFALFTVVRRYAALHKVQQAETAVVEAPVPVDVAVPQDNTVEYLVIPEDAEKDAAAEDTDEALEDASGEAIAESSEQSE